MNIRLWHISIRMLVLLTALCSTLVLANRANAADLFTSLGTQIEQLTGRSFADDYSDGNKWVVTLSGEIAQPLGSVGLTMSIDLADFLGFTPEGKQGWVTVWVDSFGALGTPGGPLAASIGVAKRAFPPNQPDKPSSFIDCSSDVGVGAYNFDTFDVVNAGETSNISVNLLPSPVSASISGFCSFRGLSFEVNKYTFLDRFRRVATPGMTASEFTDALISAWFGTDGETVRFGAFPLRIRTVTYGDGFFGDEGVIRRVLMDQLETDTLSEVVLSVKVRETGYYKFNVRNRAGWKVPMSWKWPSKDTGTYYLTANEYYSIKIPVTPTSDQATFEFFAKQWEPSSYLYKKIDTVQSTLFANPAGTDQMGPWILSSEFTTDPGTTFSFVFDESIGVSNLDGSITTSNLSSVVTLTGSVSGPHDVSVLWDETTKQLTVLPLVPFKYGEVATLEFGTGLSDLHGNTIGSDPISLSVSIDSLDIRALSDDAPQTGAIDPNQWVYYYVDVPSRGDKLNINLRQLAGPLVGQPAFYLAYGQIPTKTNYDCPGYLVEVNGELKAGCSMNAPSAGRWYVGVKGYGSDVTPFLVTSQLVPSEPPTIAITSHDVATDISTTAASIVVSGSAADNVRVQAVSWTNALGDRGTATQTSADWAWTSGSIPLKYGQNRLVFYARDNTGNTAVAELYVVRSVPKISGMVTDFRGSGIPGARITFGVDDGYAISNSSGYYDYFIAPGWSGTTTVSKSGYLFPSPQRQYTAVTGNLTAQNFINGKLYSKLRVSGPTSASSGGTATYSATAVFANGSTQDVSADAAWSISPVVGTITKGVYSPGTVTNDSVVSVKASHAVGGLARSGTANVAVNGARLLTGISVRGPTDLAQNSQAQYQAFANFNDGSSVDVSANVLWAEDSTAASISTAGTLRTTAVTAETPVSVSTTYSYQGSSYTGSASVTIHPDVVIAGAVRDAAGVGLGGVSLQLSGLPSTPVSDASGAYTATVPYGWSGSITPAKSSYSFTPETLNHINVTGSISGQSYLVSLSNGHGIPTARNDSMTTYQDLAVSKNLLENDIDSDGDVLHISAVDGTSASGGTITWLSGGSVTYTPKPGFVGFDSFQYAIADDFLGVAEATANINVLPSWLSRRQKVVSMFAGEITSVKMHGDSAVIWNDSGGVVSGYKRSPGSGFTGWNWAVSIPGWSPDTGGGSSSLGYDGETFMFPGFAGTATGAVYNYNASGVASFKQYLLNSLQGPACNFSVSGSTAACGWPDNSQSGIVWLFKRDLSGAWVSDNYLRASDRQLGDRFGTSVALIGDIIVVGASVADGRVVDSGAVYVFERDAAGSWVETAKLLPQHQGTNTEFGASVSFDGNTIVVGEPGSLSGNAVTGAAYFYSNDVSGTWVLEKRVTANDAVHLGRFGESVAVDANRAVVASPSDQSAYVFEKNQTSSWRQSMKLIPSNRQGVKAFATDVDIDGNDVLVGGTKELTANNPREAAYFFGVGNSVPVLSGIPSLILFGEGSNYVLNITATDPDGDALTLSAQGLPEFCQLTDNGDGTGSVVCTPGYNDAGNYSGTSGAVSFSVTDGLLSATSRPTIFAVGNVNPPSHSISGVVYGMDGGPLAGTTVRAEPGGLSAVSDASGVYSVDVPYDWSGTVTASMTGLEFAPFSRTHTNVIAGVAGQSFVGAPTSLVQADSFIDEIPLNGNEFGYRVATDGKTVVISNDSFSAGMGGEVSVYEQSNTGEWAKSARLVLPAMEQAASDDFGSSLAVEGDTLFVGDRLGEANGVNSGAVHVYKKETTGTWAWKARLVGGDTGTGDRFGRSMDVRDGVLAVSAERHPYDPVNFLSGPGAVYVFGKTAAGEWTQSQKMVPSDGALGYSSTRFGRSVATDGKTIVVGDRNNARHPGNGVAYVFEIGPNGLWEERQILQGSQLSTGGFPTDFGQSVSVENGIIAVGDDSRGASPGLYIFEKNAAKSWTEVFFGSPSPLQVATGWGTQYSCFGHAVRVDGGHVYAVDPCYMGTSSWSDAVFAYGKGADGRWALQSRWLPPTQKSDVWGFGNFSVRRGVAVLGSPQSTITDATGQILTTAGKAFIYPVGTDQPPVMAGAPSDQVVEATGPLGGVASYLSPTVTDDYDGQLDVTCSPASGVTFPIGVTAVACSAGDFHGQTAATTFNVTVQDTTPPVITGTPENILVPITTPVGPNIDYALPTAFDLVDGNVLVSCLPESGTITRQLGTTRVTCSASDNAGNPAETGFDVVITDIGAPVMSNVPTDIVTEASGPDGAVVTFTNPTATDGVDGLLPVACAPASGTTFALGTATVTCGASDNSGNPAEAAFNVTVEDTTQPLLIGVPADITISLPSGASTIVDFVSPTATDMVDGVVAVSCTPASGSSFGVGTTPVSCSTTDVAGNPATALFNVIVSDTGPPVFSGIPANMTVEASGPLGTVVDYVPPVANDDVDGSVGVNCIPASGSTFGLGTAAVTCSASDSSNNLAETGFTVLVQDTTEPLFSGIPADITVSVATGTGAVVDYVLPIATDLVDGDVAVECTPLSGSLFGMGTTQVVCSASDVANNPALATFNVNINDTGAPVISGVPADMTVEATGPLGAAATFTPPTALDDVDGVVPVTCDPVSGTTFAMGTTVVGCSAVDSSLNRSSVSFNVTVADTAPPVLTGLPSDIDAAAGIGANALVTYTPPTATDLVDKYVNVVCLPASGTWFDLGTTVVTCAATDFSGNTAKGTFAVNVSDKDAPIISGGPSNVITEAYSPQGGSVNYGLPSARDIVDGVVPVTCSPGSGMFSLGDTVVSCSATDSNGNTATSSFTISVVDTTAPVLRAPADVMYDATSAEGATVGYSVPSTFDLVSGELIPDCGPTSGSIFPIGVTNVGCSVSDGAGNTASASFNVTVMDREPVLVGVPAEQTVETLQGFGSATVDYTAPTAIDVVDGDVPVSCSPPSGEQFLVGTTTVTCQAQDSAANVVTGSFDVTVLDWELVHRPDTPEVLSLTPSGENPLTWLAVELSPFVDPDLGDQIHQVNLRVIDLSDPNAQVVYLGRTQQVWLGTDPAFTLPRHVLLPGRAYGFEIQYIDTQWATSEWSAQFMIVTPTPDPKDMDGNGIEDQHEVAGPSDVDQNGIDDRADGVRVIKDAVKGLPIGVAASQAFVGQLSVGPSRIGPDTTQPNGTVNVRVEEVDRGAVDLAVYFTEAFAPDAVWWMQGAGPAQASVFGNAVYITVTDGGDSDLDGVANGVVIISGGVGIPNGAPTPPVLRYPQSGATGVPTSFTFVWGESVDPDGEQVRYDISYCENATFFGCVEYSASMGVLGKSVGAAFAVVGSVWAVRRRRYVATALLIVGVAVMTSCGGGGGGDSAGGGSMYPYPPYPDQGEVGQSVTGLQPNTTYYWKVIATDQVGMRSESTVRSFTTGP